MHITKMEISEPSMIEMEIAMKLLKNYRAQEVDLMLADLIKMDGRVFVSIHKIR